MLRLGASSMFAGGVDGYSGGALGAGAMIVDCKGGREPLAPDGRTSVAAALVFRGSGMRRV
jgi:hypothetical protein